MSKIKKLFTSKKGFTLIELLVVLAIIGVLMMLATIGLLRFRSSIKVTNAANELVENLRRARRMAADNVSSTQSSDYLILGYALLINPTDDNYSLYFSAKGLPEPFNPEKLDLKSKQYDVLFVSDNCNGVFFQQVTGFFDSSCDITVKSQNSLINTERVVRIDSNTQTITIE